MKKLIIAIVIVAAFVLVAAFVPLVEAEFRHTETYLEDEPYQVTETYTEIVDLNYEATSYVKDGTIVERYETIIPGLPPMYEEKEVPIQEAWVEVKNRDDIAGIFTVRFTGFSPLMPHLMTRELEIPPGEVRTAVCPADTEEIGDWDYTVEPSTKEVEKERTVTKYREVERERLIIQYERVPILEYLRSRS